MDGTYNKGDDMIELLAYILYGLLCVICAAAYMAYTDEDNYCHKDLLAYTMVLWVGLPMAGIVTGVIYTLHAGGA